MTALDQLHDYLRPRLTAWKDRLPTTLMHTAYTGMAAGVLWPLVAAMQGGDTAVALALGQLLGNVGAGLLTNAIQQWKDEASAAQAIDTAPADLRADLDKVLAALQAPRLATEALREDDRAWFERTLKDNLQTLGNRTMYEQAGALNVFLQAGASISNSNVAVNQTINTTTIIHPPPAAAPSRREAYLRAVLAGEYRLLPLQALDTRLRAKGVAVQMSEVYVPLLTLTPEEHDQWARGERDLDRETRRLSALEQLDKHQRLLLLGDPGFGKSTFVNLLTLCLAGEALNDPALNHATLTAPVPHQDPEQAQPQTWSQRDLLPVRVVLREFAATLPANGTSADLLWQFVVRQLQAMVLEDFAPELHQHLHDGGGLILLDGLDEVPQADARRAQLIAIVHAFARAFPQCRVLVTARVYAYRAQDWRLNDFAVTTLAPFTLPQMQAFANQWYTRLNALHSLNATPAALAAELLRNITERRQLYDLAQQPLLLTFMAGLRMFSPLPDRRQELYEKIVSCCSTSGNKASSPPRPTSRRPTWPACSRSRPMTCAGPWRGWPMTRMPNNGRRTANALPT